MATKKQEIEILIKKEYGYPILQELLAEFIYETRSMHTQSMEKRYNAVIKALIGSPRKEVKKAGYRDDTKLLARAAVMTTSCLKKNLKPNEKRRFLTASEACEEVARMDCLKKYKFQGCLPANLDEGDSAKIRATKTRLLGKLEGKVDYYAREHFKHGTEQAHAWEEAMDEIEYLEGLIPNWMKRYCVKTDLEQK